MLSSREIQSCNVVQISHHPEDHRQSPCTSVYNLFQGDRAWKKGERFVRVGKDADTVAALESVTSLARPLFLFNSFASLTAKGGLEMLTHAVKRNIPVLIYWHETAWNLREFIHRDILTFNVVRPLLSAENVSHWVPTHQNKQILMTLFGFAFEAIQVVFETVDLAEPAPQRIGIRKDKLRCVGAGLPNHRKGIDYFMEIAQQLREIDGVTFTYDWFEPRPGKNQFTESDAGKLVRWQGNSKIFKDRLAEYDVFLMTSRDDPSPIVCLEALHTGLPIFVFGTTGYVEVLPEEFVCSDLGDMMRKLRNYVLHRDEYSPEFFKQIAAKHDISQFPAKLSSADQTERVPMPACDTAELLGLPDASASEVPRLTLELVNERAVLQERRSEYEDLLRRGNSTLAEHKAKVSTALKQEAKRSEEKEARLLDQIKELKRALRFARTETKQVKRKEVSKSLGKTEVRRVLIVGNAPSAIAAPLGKEVDSFDLVVRINDFQIEGFEECIGTKTDFVVITPATRPNAKLASMKRDRILLFSAQHCEALPNAEARMLREDGCRLTLKDVTHLSPTLYFYGLKTLMELPSGTWASSGSVAIQWALDNFIEAEVYTLGIDFFSGTTETINHYFAHSTVPDNKHSWYKEERYFLPKFLEGKLKKLT